MILKIKDEVGEKTFTFEKNNSIHEILQKNGINVQNYIIRKDNEIISERERLNQNISLELVKIVSGG